MTKAMEKKTQKIHPDQWLDNLTPAAEIETFSDESMLTCEKCSRKSPPTRLKCLYCGNNLPISADQSQHLKPALRKLEDWEKGFNVIWQPTENSADLPKTAALLHLDTADLTKIFAVKQPLPLARAESELEAEVLVKYLLEFGIESKIIKDTDLETERMPKRLRGIDFQEDKIVLILFNADEIVQIDYAEVI